MTGWKVLPSTDAIKSCQHLVDRTARAGSHISHIITVLCPAAANPNSRPPIPANSPTTLISPHLSKPNPCRIALRKFHQLSSVFSYCSLEGKLSEPRVATRQASVVLERMVLELRGVACLGLEEVTPDRKSPVASRSFGQAVETRRGLEEAVSRRERPKRCAGRISRRQASRSGSRPTASNRPNGNTPSIIREPRGLIGVAACNHRRPCSISSRNPAQNQ
jgi:hypothetical protein